MSILRAVRCYFERTFLFLDFSKNLLSIKMFKLSVIFLWKLSEGLFWKIFEKKFSVNEGENSYVEYMNSHQRSKSRCNKSHFSRQWDNFGSAFQAGFDHRSQSKLVSGAVRLSAGELCLPSHVQAATSCRTVRERTLVFLKCFLKSFFMGIRELILINQSCW